MERIDARHLPEFSGHEQVLRFEDTETGLLGFVAIHNTNLGPAVGGTRMFPYKSERDALQDVLRLSRAMTYKCALAGVRFGGGKAVIIANPKKDKTEALIRVYARLIGSLDHQFFTGEDVGISESDVRLMLQEADTFIGKPGLAEDPSPYAALSTLSSIKASAKHILLKPGITGLKVAVKGVGKVGRELVRLLLTEGASVVFSDIDRAAVKNVQAAFPAATAVSNTTIHSQTIDVYAPCALGDEFTERNKIDIKAKIICGAANNQLASDAVGEWLFNNGVTYIPDYVANAGGLINVVDELEPGGYQRQRVLDRINNIPGTVEQILAMSKVKNRAPHLVADELAEHTFAVPKK